MWPDLSPVCARDCYFFVYRVPVVSESVNELDSGETRPETVLSEEKCCRKLKHVLMVRYYLKNDVVQIINLKCGRTTQVNNYCSNKL